MKGLAPLGKDEERQELDLEAESHEIIPLQQFSERVEDLDESKETLLRFLRARDLDISKAEQMLRKSVKWREENDVDSYREWEIPKALADDYIFLNLGNDFNGFPVMYIPLGRWNVRDRIVEGYHEETRVGCYHLLEGIIMEALRRAQRSQFNLIVDVAHLTFYKVAHMDTINIVINIFRDFEANYPERLKSAYVINTPWIFPYAFSLVKPFLGAKTLEKVTIHDGNQTKWLPFLQKEIPSQLIPPQLFI